MPTWGQPPSAVRRSKAPRIFMYTVVCRALLDRTAEGGCPHAGSTGFESVSCLVQLNSDFSFYGLTFDLRLL